MSATEVLGVVAYLVVIWAVSAAAAGAVMYGTGLAYYGVVRLLQSPGRKHGRRLTHAHAQGRSVRRRVYPLV